MLRKLPWAERIGIAAIWIALGAVTFLAFIGFAKWWTVLFCAVTASLFTFLAVWIAAGRDMAKTEADLLELANDVKGEIVSAEHKAEARAKAEWDRIIAKASPAAAQPLPPIVAPVKPGA